LTGEQIERLEAAAHALPFVSLLGIKLEAAEPGSAVMSMAVRDELKRDHGVVHGGAIATLIDTCTAFAIIPLLAEDEHSVTIDLTISLFTTADYGNRNGIGQNSAGRKTNNRPVRRSS
jgi:uncharacterized protein (TIGR00369 family)